ncbi:RNA polymerase II-associated protein spaghetti [Andrena cerasifolii]|uniref:RNA polymerase II-associated protein spaghetti n=1 Tax=Andrena cerasifolii TaxID=2819439 RepID=UPI004037820E
MDQSIFIQKQVKDNAEDLQKEFLDMKNWEEQMKHKEEELKKETSGQTSVPPVRSKNKGKTKKASGKQNGADNKPKRIKSYDYSAWEKFDEDKACKDVEKEEQSDHSDEEVTCKEALKESYEVATRHKNEGNIFVQQQKWAKAIASYNQAIKAFSYDAVFYANRALCQLKLDNFHSAESDCTIAIRLDETYVKAYYRRATARVNLQQYKEAKQDLDKVLQLDPLNMEAKVMLLKIGNKIKVPESDISLEESAETSSETSSIERKIGEKIWSDTPQSIQITEITDTEDSMRSKEDERNVERVKDFKHAKEQKTSDTSDVSPTGDSATKTEKRDPRIPDWLPERNDVAVIEPIKKVPHLRSKKSLTRIPVKEVEFGAMGYNHGNEKTLCNESKLVESKNTDDEFKKSNDLNTVIESSENINIPPVPKTAVQFVMNWKTNKSSEFRYKYLKKLPENNLPKIFQDSMESDIFNEILEVLKVEFVKRKEPIFCYLRDLSQVKRFRALIMFISNSEKDSLKILFDHCKNIENVSEEEVTALRNKYEV